ncbi:MAG TPA: SRPBCC family protein [Capillimicrobium sp.]|nr:SRPBCC family protein [Capillimicrobium sp.]
MSTDRIERETLVNAPVERVWDVLTQAEHIGSWFCDAGADVDLRPGGSITLRWEQHGTAKCRLERVEPPHALSWRWPANDAPDRHGDPAPGQSTLVEFTLEPVADGTRLRVVETGFDALAGRTDEQRERLHDGNVEGWEVQLGRVAEYAQRARV